MVNDNPRVKTAKIKTTYDSKAASLRISAMSFNDVESYYDLSNSLISEWSLCEQNYVSSFTEYLIWPCQSYELDVKSFMKY